MQAARGGRHTHVACAHWRPCIVCHCPEAAAPISWRCHRRAAAATSAADVDQPVHLRARHPRAAGGGVRRERGHGIHHLGRRSARLAGGAVHLRLQPPGLLRRNRPLHVSPTAAPPGCTAPHVATPVMRCALRPAPHDSPQLCAVRRCRMVQIAAQIRQCGLTAHPVLPLQAGHLEGHHACGLRQHQHLRRRQDVQLPVRTPHRPPDHAVENGKWKME